MPPLHVLWKWNDLPCSHRAWLRIGPLTPIGFVCSKNFRSPRQSRPTLEQKLKNIVAASRQVSVAPGSRPLALAKPALMLPLAFTFALAGLALLPDVGENANVLRAVLGAAGALFLWQAILFAWAAAKGRTFSIAVVLKKQHYIQACAQGSVLLYWGWYWPQVYASILLLIAQLLFAYAFDTLLAWSRYGKSILGFAPFPVVFSINLFLWFKPDWFYLQFAMIAVGMAAKDLIRWNRDGRRVHIFNPSSFPLAVFSLILLATGNSDITWGQDIAITQFYPPHMYLMLFLIGLPGQFFFGVTSMTMSAVLAAWGFSRLYFAATGVYFFYDSYIPIAVFLGMHLLFTDPSTSPRSGLGRIVYGGLYGLATVGFYWLLASAGLPTFYDKLLPVPLLNLSVKAIDRVGKALSPANWPKAGAFPQRNLAYISVWAVVFTVMNATQAVGDDHPGQWLPFWREACRQGRSGACSYLAGMEMRFCRKGSRWACNEVSLLQRSGTLSTASPTLADYPIILRGSKDEIRGRSPSALYALACREGWSNTCHRE
jgi:hypothetical protein